MKITTNQIRSYRLQTHHLDQKLPAAELLAAAGACGLQNSPPGAWETALYNRLENCTLKTLNTALYKDKSLLQAWSYRGVPVVFPTAQSDIFLTPLIAQAEEQPWIYTRGIPAALDHLQMDFDDLLLRTQKAAKYLDTHTIKSKEVLDQTLADIIEKDLPEEKHSLWRTPSMYGNPDKQTVGGAAVSFLLRPCAFYSLVVFGERQGHSPTFTSFKNWTGHAPVSIAEVEKEFVRKFLHCYGPATVDHFMSWVGCSKAQAKRLWNGIADEMTPVEFAGRTCYLLSVAYETLLQAENTNDRLILLGAHDPYLDLRDRSVILTNKTQQKAVWRFVANPGVVLKGGRIIGIWKGKALKNKLDLSITLWAPTASAEQKELKQLAEEYAAFRLLKLRNYTMEEV